MLFTECSPLGSRLALSKLSDVKISVRLLMSYTVAQHIGTYTVLQPFLTVFIHRGGHGPLWLRPNIGVV
jgi:hypothetical protein